MSERISNTGDLRKFLANMMLGVRDGSVKTDQASHIVKLAGMQLERKVADLGKLELDK